MPLADDCRHWSKEMHRAADVVAEAGAHVEIVDGNRAIADVLGKAAARIDELEAEVSAARAAAFAEIWRRLEEAVWRDGEYRFVGRVLRKMIADIEARGDAKEPTP